LFLTSVHLFLFSFVFFPFNYHALLKWNKKIVGISNKLYFFSLFYCDKKSPLASFMLLVIIPYLRYILCWNFVVHILRDGNMINDESGSKGDESLSPIKINENNIIDLESSQPLFVSPIKKKEQRKRSDWKVNQTKAKVNSGKKHTYTVYKKHYKKKTYTEKQKAPEFQKCCEKKNACWRYTSMLLSRNTAIIGMF